MRRKTICLREYEFPQKTAVIQKLVIFFIQLHLQLQRAVIHADLQSIGQEATLTIRDVNTIVVLGGYIVEAEGIDLLALMKVPSIQSSPYTNWMRSPSELCTVPS